MWTLCSAIRKTASVFFLVSACASIPLAREPISAELGLGILKHATSRLGKKYHWTGNGPETFDCSGLLVYSYQQALGKRQIFSDGSQRLYDANIDWIVHYNSIAVAARETRPGDLVFIADETGTVVHGGILVSLDKETVKFVNASGYFKRVSLDEWPLNLPVRGQTISGFGRFLMP